MSIMSAGPGRANRPERDYETGPITKLIRILTVVFSIATLSLALVFYSRLPETIPTHFGITGEPDAWGPRSSILPLLFIFAAVVGGITLLSFFPRSYNYLGEVTTENAQRMYRRGEQMMVCTAASVSLIYAGIALGTVFDFNAAAIILSGAGGLLVSIVVGLIRMVRAAKPVD